MDVTGSIAAAFIALKKLREIAEKTKDAETTNLIADLNLGMSELKMEIVINREEIATLKQQLDESQQAKETRTRLRVTRGAYYYIDTPPKGWATGPYCTTCFDTNGKMILATVNRSQGFLFHCGACGNHFGGR